MKWIGELLSIHNQEKKLLRLGIESKIARSIKCFGASEQMAPVDVEMIVYNLKPQTSRNYDDPPPSY